MLQTPKHLNIFVPKAIIYPLKVAFFGIAFYFLLDAYEIFSTGIAHGRYGKIFTVHSDLIGYLLALAVKLVLVIFFSVLALGVKEKVNNDQN